MWKSKLMFAALCLMFLCGGCESAELEQRGFPLAVGIDLQETVKKEDVEKKLVVSFDFPDLAQISEKGKNMDTPMGMSLEGSNMYHVEKSYENNTNRMLDYNHIKAMVLGERLLSDAKSPGICCGIWNRKRMLPEIPPCLSRMVPRQRFYPLRKKRKAPWELILSR